MQVLDVKPCDSVLRKAKRWVSVDHRRWTLRLAPGTHRYSCGARTAPAPTMSAFLTDGENLRDTVAAFEIGTAVPFCFIDGKNLVHRTAAGEMCMVMRFCLCDLHVAAALKMTEFRRFDFEDLHVAAALEKLGAPYFCLRHFRFGPMPKASRKARFRVRIETLLAAQIWHIGTLSSAFAS